MVRALASPPREDGPVRGWLATVMRNVSRQRGRSEGRRVAHEARAGGPNGYPTPEESVLLAEQQHVVVGAVLALPEPYRHTLIQHFFDGLTEKEIAEAGGISRSTVQSRIRRGSELLREDLHRRYGDGWAAAILPLALWPTRPPVLTSSPTTPAGQTAATRSAFPVARFVAAVVLVGLLVFGLWWGDWATKTVDPGTAVAPAAPAATRDPDVRRAHVKRGATETSRETPPRDDGVGTVVVDEPDQEGMPSQTPEGAIRVRVEGIAIDPGSSARVLIQPLPVRAQVMSVEGMPVPRAADLDAAVADVDVRGIFGDDVDVTDADVTLFHPDIVPITVRCIPAGPGDQGIEAVFRVEPAALVTGRVLGPGGAPVARATVLAGMDFDWLQPYTDRSVVDETTTDAAGRYRLRVPPGSRVAVLAWSRDLAAGHRLVTALGASEEVPVDVDLGHGESISGRVLLQEGEDGSGLHVTATVHRNDDGRFRGREAQVLLEGDQAIKLVARAPVATDGAFVLHGLSRWEYRVEVESPRREGATRGRESALEVCAAPHASLELEQRLVAVPFVVRDADGVPLVGAGVSTLDAEGLGASARVVTDEDGRAIVELRPGREFTWVAVASQHVGKSGTVATPESGPASEIVATLARPADVTWSVRIENPDGTPVRQAAFEVVSVGTGRRVGVARELSSADGVFVVEGLERGLHDVRIRIGASWADTRSYWHDLERRPNVPNDEPVETIVLGSDVGRGGRLRILPHCDDRDLAFGRVTLTRDGQDVPCRLAVRQYTSLKSTGTSLSTGRPNDVLPVLEPGTYEVQIERTSPPLCSVIRRSVTIDEGRVTRIDVDLTAR